MRLLALGDVPPWVVGGAETQTWRLAQAWRAQGCAVDIAGHRIPTTVVDGLSLYHLSVFHYGGRLFRAMSYFLSLAHFLVRRRQQYDLVYCRFLGEAALVVSILKRLRLISLPLVVVPASGGRSGNADAALLQTLPATGGLVRLLSGEVDCVNYITPGVESAMQALAFDPRRVARIPNGVPVPSERVRTPIRRLMRLVFVGRLVEEKGLDVLLNALAKLRARGRVFQLKIVGDGPLRNILQEQTRQLGLDQWVEFAGQLNAQQVSATLRCVHLFVLPSRYEGMSNSALEAMAHGLPVLLSRCDGLDALITPTMGWTFAIDDIDMLANALDEALGLTPEQWRQRSDACRALIEEYFSIEAVAAAYLDLFISLVR